MNRRRLQGLIPFLFLPVLALAQDEADLGREKNLHRVYEKFNAQPTSEEKWQEAMKQAPNATYDIQKGDTLWDISDTFFGDADFWPKLWSLNSGGIFNPHEITPGDQVEFVAGTVNEAPTVEVKKPGVVIQSPKDEKKESAKAPEPTHEMVDVDLATLDIPMPGKKVVREANSPPGSLPQWKLKASHDLVYVEELRPVVRQHPPAIVRLTSYIQDHALQPLGQVVEAEAAMTAAHENQYVVVKVPGGVAGQKYLVAGDLGILEKTEGGHTTVGTIIEVEGEIVLADVVNPQENLYRALITKGDSLVNVGSSLLTDQVQTMNLEEGGTPTDAEARIMGGAFNNDRKVFGPGEVLFLDHGLPVGQVLNVYRIEQVRDSETKQKQSPRLIGIIRIVKSDAQFSNALVLSAVEELSVGDSTSSQTRVP